MRAVSSLGPDPAAPSLIQRSKGGAEAVRKLKKHRHVIVALAFGVAVPLVPFLAWLLGGAPLSVGWFGVFLTLGASYLAAVAVAASVCAVRELTFFFRGYDLGRSVTVRTMLTPSLTAASPDHQGPAYRQGDEG